MKTVMNMNTKKKSCDRCFSGKHLYCELGYETGGHLCKSLRGINLFGIPLEKCPKPLTIDDHFFALKWYKKVK